LNNVQRNPLAPGESLRVLVVDDSAVVREVMQAVLGTDRNIKVITAADPLIAFAKIEREKPHVIVTDLEMPRMDGLTFIRTIMAHQPLPVVVCSGFAEKRMDIAISALRLGAVEVITKPKLGVRDFLHESAVMLLDAVWSAASAKVTPRLELPVTPKNTADAVLPLGPTSRLPSGGEKFIAIGSSTGGTEAIREFLQAMPADCPGIVIVQHMPEMFTRAFAERLNKDCKIQVKEASHGDAIQAGRALLAPGNFHMLVQRSSDSHVAQVIDGPLVSRHRPSVDVLFRSVAKAAGSNSIGILMTGMGDDGAQGLLEMRSAGAHTIAQDEASCVVFGMPKEAISRGAATEILPLTDIAAAALNRGRHKRRNWRKLF
jgi:two-component system, chemotaxis family, protein-glutamate methylesterase/glutaminase